MKIFSVLRLSAVFTLLCSLSMSAMAQTPSPVGSIFSNKGELGIESVRNAALSQMTTTPYYKSNGEETVWFEGYFRAASNSSKLALLSDDGTSVWIDGEQVLNRAGKTQGFEGEGTHRRGETVWKNGFDVTFYPLSKTFVAGQVYHLKLEYTNTIHDSEADVDGVSLWAYDGGGDIVTVETKIALFFWDYLSEETKTQVDQGPSVPEEYDAALDSSLSGDESTETAPYCAGVNALTVSSGKVAVKWWYSDQTELQATATDISSVTPTQSISSNEWQTLWGMSLNEKQAYDERGSVAAILTQAFVPTPNGKHMFIKVKVSPDGVLDNLNNAYDANPETTAIEDTTKYKVQIGNDGSLTILETLYE